MPPPVGRKRLVLGLLVVGTLALAGSAAAGTGGFGPQTPHSPNARSIDHAYWLVFALTAAVFVIVEGVLIAFIVKYRSRGRARSVEGAQVHGHTRLELIWTVIPVLILAAIAGFVFSTLPSSDNSAPAASRTSALHVQVIGHQFYWEFRYPNNTYAFNTMHVPVNTVVDLDISATDVIHSWWIPELGGKTDAIPGHPNHTWFEAQSTGQFTGQCAEFCGLYHARMKQSVTAESAQDYAQWLAATQKSLGRTIYQGVCQQCHGIAGKGGYGPPLAGNPLTQQPSGIETIVRHGRSGTIGVMPAVGMGWTNTEMKALTDYLKTLGASGGGTTSGG
jgi:cytochrome c oxidase subunit 2